MTPEQWLDAIKTVGFPIAVSVFCLSICGWLSKSMYGFVTGSLVEVIERSTAAIEQAAANYEAVDGRLSVVLDTIQKHQRDMAKRPCAMESDSTLQKILDLLNAGQQSKNFILPDPDAPIAKGM